MPEGPEDGADKDPQVHRDRRTPRDQSPREELKARLRADEDDRLAAEVLSAELYNMLPEELGGPPKAPETSATGPVPPDVGAESQVAIDRWSNEGGSVPGVGPRVPDAAGAGHVESTSSETPVPTEPHSAPSAQPAAPGELPPERAGMPGRTVEPLDLDNLPQWWNEGAQPAGQTQVTEQSGATSARSGDPLESEFVQAPLREPETDQDAFDPVAAHRAWVASIPRPPIDQTPPRPERKGILGRFRRNKQLSGAPDTTPEVVAPEAAAPPNAAPAPKPPGRGRRWVDGMKARFDAREDDFEALRQDRELRKQEAKTFEQYRAEEALKQQEMLDAQSANLIHDQEEARKAALKENQERNYAKQVKKYGSEDAADQRAFDEALLTDPEAQALNSIHDRYERSINLTTDSQERERLEENRERAIEEGRRRFEANVEKKREWQQRELDVTARLVSNRADRHLFSQLTIQGDDVNAEEKAAIRRAALRADAIPFLEEKKGGLRLKLSPKVVNSAKSAPKVVESHFAIAGLDNAEIVEIRNRRTGELISQDVFTTVASVRERGSGKREKHLPPKEVMEKLKEVRARNKKLLATRTGTKTGAKFPRDFVSWGFGTGSKIDGPDGVYANYGADAEQLKRFKSRRRRRGGARYRITGGRS